MSDIQVINDTPNLPLLLQGKNIKHLGAVRVSEDIDSIEVLEMLKQKALNKNANMLLLTYEKRIDGTLWVMKGNALMVTDAE
jgi:hypothetical protein